MDRGSELSGKSSELSGKSVLMDANLSGKVMADMCSGIEHVLAKGSASSLSMTLRIESCSIHCRILHHLPTEVILSRICSFVSNKQELLFVLCFSSKFNGIWQTL